MAKGFESSAPTTPRSGQHIDVTAFTDNENTGVVVLLVPCDECGAAVEDGAGKDKHEQWHAEQAGAEPKSKSSKK